MTNRTTTRDRLRSYSEMIQFEAFEERFDYLRLGGGVGQDTFGFDRWINQAFYRSKEWRDLRNHIIVRDGGCDLAVPGYEIHSGGHIHHMNPMSVGDIQDGNPDNLDPEFLILVSQQTHNAIHYGTNPGFRRVPEPRRQGDTKLW